MESQDKERGSETSAVPASEYEYLLAYRDTLTGIANRYAFDQKLKTLLDDLTRGEIPSITVMFLDLDRFKAVNDTLGHGVGDVLLRLVAERLTSAIPESATLARLGGDEFSILLTGGDRESTRVVADKCIDLLRRAFLIEGNLVHIGVSIGISHAPDDAILREQLLKYADLALYCSKYAGRGGYHFFVPQMEEQAQERRQLELDLRRALMLRQFEMHYKPQIDVERGAIFAVEGLVRWRHPKRGLLMPEEFLPFAEILGIALPITEWMLKTLCRTAARWSADVKFALNVSALQFEAAPFAHLVENALLVAGVPGDRLELEVTEDILLREADPVLKTLGKLQALGVRVAMDEFGVGLTSLSQLVNIPFDKIKIHRSLTGSALKDPKSRAVVRAISALGGTLGIETMVEGVTTSEDLADVRSHGCSTLLGFYSGEPLTVNELEQVLATATVSQSPAEQPVVTPHVVAVVIAERVHQPSRTEAS
jgi:diguanylate cyclase (GGDEF)-like protein